MDTPLSDNEHGAEHQATDPERSSAKPNTILIVEDSQVQAKIIRNQIVAMTAFDTRMVHNLGDCREFLRFNADQIGLAVVDLNLPDAPDGEAVEIVLSHHIPAVVLTATFNDDIRNKFIENRVSDYFFKGSIRDMDPMVHSLERLATNRCIKVLVVDDSKANLSYLKALLETQNFRHIHTALDGDEALEVLAEHPDIRLVITDYNMPRMDGFELTKRIRESYKKNQLAIIGVSAAGSGKLTALFLKNGANDFLTKPFEVEEFYWRVNQNIEMLEMFEEIVLCQEQND